MKKKGVKYTEGPIGDVKVVRDALPPPSELAFKEEQVKVTIGLSKSSVDFFKKTSRASSYEVPDHDSTATRHLCRPTSIGRESDTNERPPRP